jgi:hypothetical protein
MEGMTHGWMWFWWILVLLFLITGIAAFIKYLFK